MQQTSSTSASAVASSVALAMLLQRDVAMQPSLLDLVAARASVDSESPQPQSPAEDDVTPVKKHLWKPNKKARKSSSSPSPSSSSCSSPASSPCSLSPPSLSPSPISGFNNVAPLKRPFNPKRPNQASPAVTTDGNPTN